MKKFNKIYLIIFSVLFLFVSAFNNFTFSQELEVKFSKEPIPDVPLFKGEVAPAPLPERNLEPAEANLKKQANLKNQTKVITPIVNKNTGKIENSESINKTAVPNLINKPVEQEEAQKNKGSFTFKITSNTAKSSSGNFGIGYYDDLEIPDPGYAWVQMSTAETLPDNAVVTNVEYRLRIDDLGDPNTFYCGDYEIYLSSQASGDPTKELLVYDNLGGYTDGGKDDDSDDDSDIYLNGRSTTYFNGVNPAQYWSIWVEDTYSGDSGRLDYIEFTIYWEEGSAGGPNLSANFTPEGWDAPLVISSIAGTNTNGTDLKADQTVYIDFAIINWGDDIPEGTTFYTYLYDGSDYIAGWYTDGLQQNYYAYVEDAEFTFSEGNHTINLVTDATYLIDESTEEDNEYSNTFYFAPQGTSPNLIADYTPSGWDYPIVPSSVSGTRTVGPNLIEGTTTYIDFAFINRLADIPTSTKFYIYLYDGSSYLAGWYWEGIQKDYYGYVTDYNYTFSVGNHTLKTIADATGVVNESNEYDNEYSREFYWAPISEGEPDIDVQPTSLTIDQPVVNLSRQKSFTTPQEFKKIDPIDSKYIVRTFVDSKGKEISEVIVPGRPPENYRAPKAEAGLSAVTISDVPAFDWSYGCSATSAAMIAGHYDNTGYPNMYTGPENGGVVPMNNAGWGEGECPLSATHLGFDGRAVRGHVDDYWIGYGNDDTDPFITHGWTEHTLGECTGDYMATNQSYWSNSDGSTTFYFYNDGTPLEDYSDCELNDPPRRDGCHGFRLFFESRGYNVINNYSQYIYGYNGNTKGFTFAQFKQEIDAGRPVMIQVEGHTMVGYGYDDTGSKVYVHDTWDHYDHTMTWGGYYSDLRHYAITVFELEPAAIVENNFRIFNVGDSVLKVNSITENKTWLSAVGYPALPFLIQPGDNKIVTVSVDWPLLSSSDVGTITIGSNDPDEPNVVVTVTANPTGGTPVLTVNPDNYHAPSSGGNQTISVTNAGTGGPFTWEASANQTWIQVSPSNGSSGENFVIAVQPNSGEARNGNVTVTAPDASGSPKIITVTQDGIGDQVNIWIPRDLTGANGEAVLIPIHCSDVTDRYIFSSDLTINFDQTVIQVTGAEISGTVLAASGWGTPTTNISEGNISIALAGSSPLSGSGILMYLTANVIGADGATSELQFEKALFNEGDPTTSTSDGLITVASNKFSIAGNIGYYYDPSRTVKEVNLQLTGAENRTTSTGTDGNYGFSDLSSGNYTVTPGKSGEINGAISAYDASMILRYSVGAYELTPYRKIAADVSGNGSITAYDASFILRYSVGAVTSFPVGSEWTFVPIDFPIDDSNWASAPKDRAYSPLNADQSDQDFMGILYGDVSGNWTGASLPKSTGTLTLSIGQFERNENDQLVIPIEMDMYDAIYSGSFNIQLNTDALKFSTFISNNNKIITSANSNGDVIKCAFASEVELKNQPFSFKIIFDEDKTANSSDLKLNFSDVIIDDQIMISTIVADQQNADIPREWRLEQNMPNPFNPETTINYQVPSPALVTIEVFNLLGQKIQTLVNEQKTAGSFHVMWNGLDEQGRSVGSGVYICKMQADKFIAMKKMVLVR